MGKIQLFLIQGAINMLLNFVKDEENQDIARDYVRKKVMKRVASTKCKWDDNLASVALKFFGM